MHSHTELIDNVNILAIKARTYEKTRGKEEINSSTQASGKGLERFLRFFFVVKK